MPLKDLITIEGIVEVIKIENGIEHKPIVIHNKINNNMYETLGKVICNDPSLGGAIPSIYQMRIYGVQTLGGSNMPSPPQPTDDFPTGRSYIDKSIVNGGLARTANIITGTNLFSATVYNDDTLNVPGTGKLTNYYITDLILAGGRNPSDPNDPKVWSHVLAPADQGAGIGLYKTPSVSYRINWYIIFKIQE